jgi:Uma2 family endonuclease
VASIAPAPRHHYTFEDYLALEETGSTRHEYFDGAIYAMAGGTPEHAAMAAAVTAILGRQLTGSPCRVYSSDLRLRVLATGLATYPDVTVICGPSERDPSSPSHVTNPAVIVEVLSPSTADYDRGEKLEHYRRIPSLTCVLLVDGEGRQVEAWTRSVSGWEQARFAEGEHVVIDAIGCTLPVDEVLAAARDA